MTVSTRLRRPAIVLVTLLAALLAGCGSDKPATTSSGARVIQVSMTDDEFTPDVFSVDAGSDVTFRFTNDGSLVHEAFIGSAAEQQAHETEMGGMTSTTMGSSSTSMHDSGMGGHDMDTTTTGMHGSGDATDEADEVSVKPGKTGTLTHHFSSAGTVIIGCHEEGHYAKGMKATITVS
jgi:uncharacterized cupredoxin-like copper-binding protein